MSTRHNDFIRFITWNKVYDENPEHFNSLFYGFAKKYHQALWQSYLFRFFHESMNDERIADHIADYNANLLSSDAKETLLELYKIEKKKMEIFYSKKECLQFLMSTDNAFPEDFKNKLEKNISDEKAGYIQYIPNVFLYHGNLKLLSSHEKKFAIIGTRNFKSRTKVENQINTINKKHINSICVTGLASGVDSLGILELSRSIVFLGEELNTFINKKQRDPIRLKAKNKALSNGLILSHKLPHEKMGAYDYKNALQERNLFVVLVADTIHPIEFGIKSGTINAIYHALNNNKDIYTPEKMVGQEVIEKFRNKITFY